MAEVRFYHLVHTTVCESLPALLQKVSDMGIRGSLLLPTAMITPVTEALWQGGRDTNFIANEVFSDINADSDDTSIVPFLITDTVDSGLRDTVFAVDTMPADAVKGVNLVCYMFNGNDDRVLQNARVLWKALSADADNTVAYFKQTNTGSWEKKA